MTTGNQPTASTPSETPTNFPRTDSNRWFPQVNTDTVELCKYSGAVLHANRHQNFAYSVLNGRIIILAS
uniref:Uncharacterized protein n=1 Tax=Ciona intestinalis TaxID=7719 RepID=H2XS66_CIOIN